MSYKKIIPFINASNEVKSNVVSLAFEYANNGADELIIYDYAPNEEAEDKLLSIGKEVTKLVDIPVTLGFFVKRFEDVKKALYTGCSKVLLKYSLINDEKVLKEASERFGSDKLILELDEADVLTETFSQKIKDLGVGTLLIKHVEVTQGMKDKIKESVLPVIIRDSLTRNDLSELLNITNVEGVSTNYFENKEILKAKIALKKENIDVNTFESSKEFKDFKLNSDGLLPVVVQDYKTNEVLMVAYMNEEAYVSTVQTGKMTYYSRSRSELWLKGATSGHFQYLKSLSIDCDSDTLLAKVHQVGAACHTGNMSCFYTDLVKKDYDDTNPLTVFNDVFQTIVDRKKNPKEGSYTNYLFDKGIDKILKKCGEEATEIVIAAKNPDSEELKYEISDFLYHMMVLMAECGLDWEDITKELAHRR
jgi:phosphoribosyl-ATP pyrophosphohydrolase/phosphoribosyl-AMP cyclohydrolase